MLGHVDSGKTSLLDTIRGTGVQGREAGGITQHIGASFLPTQTIQKMCGVLYEKLEKSDTKIPGILVIDTPGHEVFTNLRARGGSAADIAILVVDVNRGFQHQTNESLRILEGRKVPFVIALNKCDQISGWRTTHDTNFISQVIKKQDASIQAELDQKIYDVVGTLSVLGYKSEAFYRVQDFTKEISIVPVSAKSGVGIPELLTVLVGLTQQFLNKKLDQTQKISRGIILEVNDEVGLGQTANIILIDGSMNKDDTLVIAKRDSVVTTKPKVILLPKPLDEMRDPRDKFKPVDNITAAAGVKIASPDLDGALPGSTLYISSDPSKIVNLKQQIEDEMSSVFVDTESNGVIIKCDTIGSLEAVVEMLKRESVPVAKADVGPVTRRDVMEAKAVKENDRHRGVILMFNVKVLPDAKEEAESSHIRLFSDKIIYSLIETYLKWVADDAIHQEDAIFAEMTPVAKFTFLKNNSFRNNDPAVFGIRVDSGILRQKIQFMNKNGKRIGVIHQLQHNNQSVQEANSGQMVACSVHGITIGRHINPEDEFYTLPHPQEAKKLLTQFMHKLSQEQIDTLNEIVEIQRKNDAAYGY